MDEECNMCHPQMRAPTFATLRPNFMRSFRSKMPDTIIPEIPEKSGKAEMYLRRLRQMHDLCLMNMARSRRLPDREADSPRRQEQRGNRDLILPGFDSKPGRTSQTNQLPHGSPKQSRSVSDDRPSRPQRPGRTTSASVEVRDTPVCRRETPDPLSIEDVCRQKNVKIIDCGFKLWRNYTESTHQ